MATPARAALTAPFAVRSFRFQWPADLLTAWAFEMETVILGWYVLVATDSVFLLTVFASLQFLGTLLAPMFGVIADRIGRRVMLCGLRAAFLVLAGGLMTLGLFDLLGVQAVFAIAFLAGLLKPADLVMRNALIGDTMPAKLLMNAMGVARTTTDSARIAGALIGAGLFATFGLGPSYAFIAAFYALSLALTFGVSKLPPPRAEPSRAPRPSPWRDLTEGLAYVWNTPRLLALMWLAFLVNLTAFPISHGLLPFIARDVYGVDATGLGHMVAAQAAGALAGSLALAISARVRRPLRVSVVNILLWYVALLVFGQVDAMAAGLGLLFVIGAVQSFSMVAMSVALLATAQPAFRARVMGARMLAVYGLPIGLMASGALIDWLGFALTVGLYCTLGIAGSIWIAIRWRDALWR